MSLRLLARKEARALAPTWAAAVAAVVTTELAFGHLGEVAYVGAALALGARAVGHEYGYRTVGTLLVQPVDRRVLYAVKHAVLAVMLTALAAVGWLVLETSATWEVAPHLVIMLPPAGALLFAPWMTMLCRSQLAGTLFAGIPAALVFVGAQWLAHRLHSADSEAASSLVKQVWWTAMVVIATAAPILGWRTFATLEVIESGGSAIRLPRLLTRLGSGGPTHPLWRAVIKELRLQQITMVTVALFVAGSIWGLIQVSRGVLNSDVVTVLITIYLAATALLIGSLASAEERQLGTYESELMLPIPAWRKWIVKVTVAMTLSVLFAAALPALLLSFAPMSVRGSAFLPGAIPLVFIVTAAGIYVSSLSTSGIGAMAAAFPAILGAFLFAETVDTAVSAASAPAPIPAQFDSMLGVAFVALLVVLLLWLGFINHRTLERPDGRVIQQVAGILAVIAAGVLMT